MSQSAVQVSTGQTHRRVAWVVAAALLVWLAGAVLVLETARLPASGTGTVAVLFDPGRDGERNFRAILAAGGSPVRPVVGSLLWIAHSETPGFAGRLRAEGARAVYGELSFGPVFAGCFAYVPSEPRKAPNLMIR